MNLRQAFKFCKRYFSFSDEELAEYLGISRPQVTKINGGYVTGLTIGVMKRISQLLRISIDELVDNRFLPPSYHFSKHIYSIYIQAPHDFLNWNIVKGDLLYIRPYTYDRTKIGQLALRLVHDGIDISKIDESQARNHFDFHIVGVSRFLYKPIEDISYQQTLADDASDFRKLRRGRPIKYE